MSSKTRVDYSATLDGGRVWVGGGRERGSSARKKKEQKTCLHDLKKGKEPLMFSRRLRLVLPGSRGASEGQALAGTATRHH